MNKLFSFAHSTVLHIKGYPYLPCSAAIKFHSITPTYHTDPALLMHCTVSASAYNQDRPCLPCSVQQLHCSNPQHNSLSMRIKMHYIPTTTTHPTAFHNPSLHTTNKHKAYLCKWWQNRTRCRDGVKVLWYHSLLVWLVFEASIPTWTCFHSENFLCLVNI